MAYLLDTNVVSELRKESFGRCHPMVSAPAGAVDFSITYLSMSLEHSQKENSAALRSWLDRLPTKFEERVIGVDTEVAQRCAVLHVPEPAPARDGLIAASALVHNLTIVTRNGSDFSRTGVTVVDAWESTSWSKAPDAAFCNCTLL
jgi:predicted nucleic acid-binding protein